MTKTKENIVTQLVMSSKLKRLCYVVPLPTLTNCKNIKSKYLFHLLLLHYQLIEIQHHINRLKCHLHSFKRGFPTLDAVKKQHFSMTKWSQKIKSPIQRGLSQRAQCPEGRLRSKNRMWAKTQTLWLQLITR